MGERYSKKEVPKKLLDFYAKSIREQYMVSYKDFFALGYMFGKYNLKDWSQNELMKGCKEYDKTDDLMLLDTIGETLIDLKYLDNSKGEI